MIQEVAYDSLPFATREVLHEQLARWLEGQGDAAVDLLAFHYGRSKNREKQREWFRKAGDAAAARYANEAAAEYYGRLVDVVEPQDRPEVLLSLGVALEQVSRWDDARKAYLRAREELRDLGSQDRRARAALALGRIHTHRAAYDDALRHLEEARAEYGSLEDRAGQMAVVIETANAHRLQGRLDEARAVLERSLGLEEDGPDKAVLARAYHVLGNVMNDMRDVAGARTWWERSLAVRRELGDKPGVAIMVVNTAFAAFVQQRPDEARLLLAEGEALCRELGIRWATSRATQLLALLSATQGEIDAARRLYEQCFVPFRDLGALRELAELLISMTLTWRIGPQPAGARHVLRLAGAGSSLFAKLGTPIPPILLALVERSLVDLRAALGDGAVDEAWNDGRSMSWSQAVDLALARTPS
jgi:tetratricopeptide (TPR) repeat protein